MTSHTTAEDRPAGRVLVVDDEKPLAQMVATYLERAGFSVAQAHTGIDAVDKARRFSPDVIVLDLGLPGMDGLEVCRQVRSFSDCYILMLTARGSEDDKIAGLTTGADDYITKPFGMRELIARIRANIRRTDAQINDGDNGENLEKIGNLTVDMNRYEVRKEGKTLDLTLREFELLKYLAEREDRVFSREQLLEEVWGYEYYGDIRTVDVTVRRLREKLEDDSSEPKYIMTKRGVGYYFRRP